MARARECFGNVAKVVAVENPDINSSIADVFEEAARYLRYAGIEFVHGVNLDWSDEIGFNLILVVE